MEEKQTNQSKIVLTDKNTLFVSGISKVISSTESLISVVIDNQTLEIAGDKLTTTKLDVDSGILQANGNVYSMRFLGHKQKENFFKRIFR